MNKRVFNALRKVAADINEDFAYRMTPDGAKRAKELAGYMDMLDHVSQNIHPDIKLHNWEDAGEYLEEPADHNPHYYKSVLAEVLDRAKIDSTIRTTRDMQASRNAGLIFPVDYDKYTKLRKGLINTGNIKFNNYMNKKSKPIPSIKIPGATPTQEKAIKDAQQLQVNNRRKNPYSNIG